MGVVVLKLSGKPPHLVDPNPELLRNDKHSSTLEAEQSPSSGQNGRNVLPTIIIQMYPRRSLPGFRQEEILPTPNYSVSITSQAMRDLASPCVKRK